ncbi:MAG: hypothetical protein B6I35_02475 [Anaerolineaceae bacterium 4572_32.2]|nr:MAG: hypothetical protein B6I35_02475 [Anaerolineaceae bacterium 4572_32.2]RLC80262.1 MAG: hypothetical protein DRI81_04335 [Chloroflexota bacterium]
MTIVSRKKILQKINQYWPSVDAKEVMDVLDRYGVKSSERGRVRVQLAILKLSAGQRERLPELVEMAQSDYRDALAYAEYPEEMQLGFVGMSNLSPEEAKFVRQRDREQYVEWLTD